MKIFSARARKLGGEGTNKQVFYYYALLNIKTERFSAAHHELSIRQIL